MKKVNFLPLFALMAAMILSACSKKNDTTSTPTKSNKELLLEKAWMVSTATINPAYDFGNGKTTDFLSTWDACDKDDLMTFHSNSTYTGDEGATKCDPGDSQTWTGAWTLSDDQKLLTIDGDASTINSISETKMTLSNSQAYGGVNYTITFTYVKK
ncbi:MAG: hypothetical protein GC180_03380 [Bacteroidetes bacterium]|nr:hypothetical protein [Bacteroidota bacterium]